MQKSSNFMNKQMKFIFFCKFNSPVGFGAAGDIATDAIFLNAEPARIFRSIDPVSGCNC